MKNSLILFGLAVFISGCQVSNYSGDYYFPENSIFDKANFKYVTTIYGSSSAHWNLFGINKNVIPKGLAASAKHNMYKLHSFKPNQIITNISVEMINSYLSFFGMFPIGGFSSTAVVSADIYEFSNNGDYFTDLNTEIHDSTNTTNSITNSIHSQTIEGEKPTHKDNPDVIYHLGNKYSIGDTVNYDFSNKPVVIEKFILNKTSEDYFDVLIKLRNNKTKITNFNYIY